MSEGSVVLPSRGSMIEELRSDERPSRNCFYCDAEPVTHRVATEFAERFCCGRSTCLNTAVAVVSESHKARAREIEKTVVVDSA